MKPYTTNNKHKNILLAIGELLIYNVLYQLSTKEIEMFTLKVFNLNKEVVEIKEFNDETEARIYFQNKYDKRDDFGNMQFFII